MTTEKPKTVDTEMIRMEKDKISSNPKRRAFIIAAATVFGILAMAGIALAATYLGHILTKDAYQEARMFYQQNEGVIVEEKVYILEEEVDFEAEGRFTVVYDFKNKLVVIRPMNTSSDRCFMANLTPDMGTMEEIRQRINLAEASGGFATNMNRTANFVTTNKTAEVPATSTKAKKLCAGRLVQWIERAAENRQTALEKLAKSPEANCNKTVVVVIIIIVTEDSCTIIIAEV